MKSISTAIAAAILAGCASTQPSVVVTPKIVEVPVAKPCISELPKEPAWALDSLKDRQSRKAVETAFVLEMEARIAYISLLRAALLSCVSNSK